MKKIYVGVVLLLLAFCTSCQFSENIYINEDGTGKVSFDMDGSELMEMMGEEMAKEKGESIDSIISFKEMFKNQKDSIAKLSKEDQEKLKKLEAFEMHMVMNTEKKKMRMNMYANFNNISEMQDMFKTMNKVGEIDKSSGNSKVGANPLSAFGSEGVSKTSYTYNGNIFKREVTVLDKGKLEAVKDSIGQAEMMFAASDYTLNYHFPKKIKSVSLDNAKISEDGKSFSISVNFMEYIKNPERLNVEVKLEE